MIQRYHGDGGLKRSPVQDGDGRLTLFLEGEIFNACPKDRSPAGLSVEGPASYREEAAYCLEVFKEHGERGFERLNGTFLIVIYDHGKQEMILANDRFGSRPLYYHRSGKTLCFGTQPGPLMAFPDIVKELDARSVFDYFTFQRVLEERTFIKGVSILPPASVLRFRDGGSEITQYWRMEYEPDYSCSKAGYSEILASRIRESVKDRLRGSQRKGLLLSGGMDSRVVLAAAKGLEALETITVADHYNNEVRTAERIAGAAGCNHVLIERTPDHYYNLIEESVRLSGGMHLFIHAHFIGHYDDFRKRCDVLFHGWPAEVYFRGSNLPRRGVRVLNSNLVLDRLRGISEDALIDVILDNVKSSRWKYDPGQLLTPEYARKLAPSVRDAVSRMISVQPSGVSPYNRYDWFIVSRLFRHVSALNILCIRPYMTERNFICDNRLLDLYLRMPPEYRVDSSIWAKAVGLLDGDIARIKDANTGLPPLTPLPLVHAKNAFTYPLRQLEAQSVLTQDSWPDYGELIRCNEKMRELIIATIDDPCCLDPSMFDIVRIKELADLHFSGRERHETELLLLLNFGIWYKMYFHEGQARVPSPPVGLANQQVDSIADASFRPHRKDVDGGTKG